VRIRAGGPRTIDVVRRTEEDVPCSVKRSATVGCLVLAAKLIGNAIGGLTD
jgi:hypothetical protein